MRNNCGRRIDYTLVDREVFERWVEAGGPLTVERVAFKIGNTEQSDISCKGSGWILCGCSRTSGFSFSYQTHRFPQVPSESCRSLFLGLEKGHLDRLLPR